MITKEELEMLLEWNEHHTEEIGVPVNPNAPWRQDKEALDEDDLPFTEPNISAEEVKRNAEED